MTDKAAHLLQINISVKLLYLELRWNYFYSLQMCIGYKGFRCIFITGT